MVRPDSYSPPSLEIKPIVEKGLGVVAVSNVPPGEVIVEEEPMVILPLNPDGSLGGNFAGVGEEFSCPQLDRTVFRLPSENRALFESLADSTTPYGKSNYGIMKTNSFSISVNYRSYLGLFPNVARINHSCAPNCHHYWTAKTGKYTVRSIEEIRPGHEITISYMSPLQRESFHRRDSRKTILKNEFGFDCQCDICLFPDITNDDMRFRIREIEKRWKEYDPEDALKQVEKQWELAVRLNFHRGLLSYICLHAIEAGTTVMKIADSKSDPKMFSNAKRSVCYFSEEALWSGGIAYGKDSPEYDLFQEIYDEVRSEKAALEIADKIRDFIKKLNSN